MTAAQILKDSVQSIKDGEWMQGEIGQKCTRTDTGEKTLGCALGLVSIHGGTAIPTRVSGVFWAQYPTLEDPRELLDAVAVLAQTTPRSYQRAMPESYKRMLDYLPGALRSEHGIEVLGDIVVNYNDRGSTDEKKALKWFEKAAKKAEELGL